ncbi:MAG: TerB family tellurite resistance protein [Acidobacteriota bacterium]|nr:TerB family tellurite resistance protein [Acidobacteriota bacterium]MDQ7086925.1 TerB family tellurite resistance protein [Acidobacteriota bacterium]
MSLLSFLGFDRTAMEGDPARVTAVRRIVDALDKLEPRRARFIACFAWLLGRVAHADNEIGEDETREMERLVHERGGLPLEQAVIVVQMAKSQNILFGGRENFSVTREFERMATREQKLALLDCLFAVSAAEGGISVVEDNEIRNISRELNLEHRDFIAIRSRYRDHLNVLRDS